MSTTTPIVSPRLGPCGLCLKLETPKTKADPAKYKCPRCGVVTCSVVCSKRHKVADSCCGQRDRTAYIRRDEYSAKEFFSDYTLLEEVDQAVRDSILTSTQGPQGGSRPGKRKYALRREAQRRGIKLSLMPCGMKRSQDNNSRVQFRTKEEKRRGMKNGLVWRVDVCRERDPGVWVRLSGIPGEESIERILERVCRKTRQEDFEASSVFLRAEGIPGPDTDTTFWKLEKTDSLDHCLAGKAVVEYPILHLSWLSDKDEIQRRFPDSAMVNGRKCPSLKLEQEGGEQSPGESLVPHP